MIHGQDLDAFDLPQLEKATLDSLLALQKQFPAHVLNPRVVGFAFAFDLPSPNLAQQLIAQRFYRGFMVYIAGTQTVRYRLNTLITQEDLNRLFAGIADAMNYILKSAEHLEGPAAQTHLDTFKAPAWVDAKSHVVKSGNAKDEMMTHFRAMASAPHGRLQWALDLGPKSQRQLCDLVIKSQGQWSAKRLASALKALLGADDAVDYKPSKVITAMQAGLENEGQGFDAWHDRLGEDPTHLLAQALGSRITRLQPAHWSSLKKDIMAIETKAYEAGRQDSEDDLKKFLHTEGSLCFKLERRTDTGKTLLGYAFGGPIESFSVAGPGSEVMNGKHNSFYTANITLHEDARHCGGGSRLKLAQVKAAASEKNLIGESRYHFVTGRNRVGHTAEIGHINKKLAAYEVEVFDNQYGDEKAQALYYRIPLQHPVLSRRAEQVASKTIEWASAVHAPLGLQPDRLKEALQEGYFTDPVGTKLTLSNWTTPEIVRYAEVLRDVAPDGLNHIYFSSSRDELVDKGLRSLRLQRKNAQLIIGLQRQYVGHTTAAARSLTDPAGFQQPFAFFDWPLVSHPAEVGTDETIAQIKKIIAKEGLTIF